MQRSHRNHLRLIELGCPGETTTTVLRSGGGCHYRTGSQLAAADSFLHRRESTVLLTVDLGFNDVGHCMTHQVVDHACVAQALDSVHPQLPQILTLLLAAGRCRLQIIGVRHNDPYLADHLDGPAGRTFAAESPDVILQLNAAMRSTYGAAGIPKADVASAFGAAKTEPTSLAELERSPPMYKQRAPSPGCALCLLLALTYIRPTADPEQSATLSAPSYPSIKSA